MPQAEPHTSLADPQMRQAALAHVFAPWVRELDLRVIEAGAGVVTLALPVAPKHVHEGGVLCGQTMMAACDTAMVLAVMTKLGGFKPMTTVQLQTSFPRTLPLSPGTGRRKLVCSCTVVIGLKPPSRVITASTIAVRRSAPRGCRTGRSRPPPAVARP